MGITCVILIFTTYFVDAVVMTSSAFSVLISNISMRDDKISSSSEIQ